MANKEMLSFWSGIPCKIDIFYKDLYISSATGFFVEYHGRSFFLSNWHVISGRNPYTGQPIINGAIPTRIVVYMLQIVESDNLNKRDMASFETSNIELYFANENSIWIQHPRGQEIDVAAIPLDLKNANIARFKELSRNSIIEEKVGSDVFILGFPKGVSVLGNHVPIWKRGSIASELSIDYQNLPVFLVDSATRDGMSGAPVIIEKHGPFQSRMGFFMPDGGGITSKFLGIYSGRFLASKEDKPESLSVEEQIQLGRVWKTSAIIDVLERGVPGDYEIRKP